MTTVLTLGGNSLDFVTLGTAHGISNGSTLVADFTLKGLRAFFDNGGDHVPIALDATGVSCPGTHIRPVKRRDTPLFSTARGFTLHAYGVGVEHWNGTPSPGVSQVNPHYLRPRDDDELRILIEAGYRAGPLANRMNMRVWNKAGRFLYGDGVSWGWDAAGSAKVVIGAIGAGFHIDGEQGNAWFGSTASAGGPSAARFSVSGTCYRA